MFSNKRTLNFVSIFIATKHQHRMEKHHCYLIERHITGVGGTGARAPTPYVYRFVYMDAILLKLTRDFSSMFGT